MTYTYAVLEVPPSVYRTIRELLAKADYQHAFHQGRDGEVIDMHGIALRVEKRCTQKGQSRVRARTSSHASR